MDCTMSSEHCGDGLPIESLEKYIKGASKDFITVLQESSKIETNFKFA